MAIVTSSNRATAQLIAERTGLADYMQCIIASEDCKRHKPDKEPFARAMRALQCQPHQCTIFEDSCAGYRSAKQLTGVRICLVLHDQSSASIRHAQEPKIRDYADFQLQQDAASVAGDADVIREELHHAVAQQWNVQSVRFQNDHNLKTGYICDIQAVKLVWHAHEEDAVLKIANLHNSMAEAAQQMNLYNNEIQFYTQIAPYVNVRIPKCYATFAAASRQALVLQDINCNGAFNRDLNRDIHLLMTVIQQIAAMHNRFTFQSHEDVRGAGMAALKTMNDMTYYKQVVDTQFEAFLRVNALLLTSEQHELLRKVRICFPQCLAECSAFPLSFCHGDLKSPNIFYSNTHGPTYLDWQYIHLNKGISDIAFLLVESTRFDVMVTEVALKYYCLQSTMYPDHDYATCRRDFQRALCLFPFFVMIWFNTERDKILDTVFPIRFMKNTLLFYEHFLDEDFWAEHSPAVSVA
jgi:thiamine kinase-like enzyme